MHQQAIDTRHSKDDRSEYQKGYYLRNKDRLNAKHREQYQENKQKKADYYQANKLWIKALKRSK
jgi:hypothetical protein